MGRRSERASLAKFLAEFETERRKRRERHERRVAKGTAAKPRPTCRCSAYPWPHRPNGGNCRGSAAPARTYAGKVGTHAPVLLRRRSAIRRSILRTYGLHAIKDRERVRRWLPKLYVAWCRRLGYGGDGFWTANGPIPAMRVTASTKPTGYPDGWEAWNRRTDWRERYSNSPARRRGRQKRQPRN